jgi:hypothetical protein
MRSITTDFGPDVSTMHTAGKRAHVDVFFHATRLLNGAKRLSRIGVTRNAPDPSAPTRTPYTTISVRNRDGSNCTMFLDNGDAVELIRQLAAAFPSATQRAGDDAITDAIRGAFK